MFKKLNNRREDNEIDNEIDDDIESYKNLEYDELIKLINQIMSRNIIDDMFDDGYIPMIYNGCYGGSGM